MRSGICHGASEQALKSHQHSNEEDWVLPANMHRAYCTKQCSLQLACLAWFPELVDHPRIRGCRLPCAEMINIGQSKWE